MSYDKKDAANDTGSSVKETSTAWHDAREDAQKDGELTERAVEKISQDKEVHEKVNEAYERIVENKK